MDRSAEIADFLRTRRARISPEAAGVPADNRPRRVPGLRRDEVARLAGISIEYYTRLEQGRAGNPSPEIIDAVGQALRLDVTEREHLTNLLTKPGGTRRSAPSGPQRVRPGLYLMMQTLDHVPAFVLGRRTDILASNALGRAVMTDFEALPPGKRNLARYLLLDPESRSRSDEWERYASETVAMLRLDASRHPNDKQLADLIGELTVHCPEFSGWWHDHKVLQRTHGAKTYRHPLVGDLVFQYESLILPGDPDQTLCVYNVEPGSPTAERIQLLRNWTAPEGSQSAPAHERL
ncbi:helix-turn-helix transcriptional regulator [Kutzneria sp. CA-103260]|uniref:helix-turn-helix transcriptional regulator n=1 Tax=Kutzneria sp. CA-103260 TaxID=2802641 RepID=UPI001BA7D63B|nr:helix-turn-helix transcriptional regulator [Kutzneria sp. CA-103260]QUQ67726.1 XRE family transcriptional regulator [Kutzneria sp. CA-103260]